jgi:hypothetical protein
MLASHSLRLALLLALTGCATTYSKSGFWGDGFTDNQLAEDVFSVTFKGNGYTDDAQARDYLLLRCADLSLEHGAGFFRLTGTASDSKDGAAMMMSGNMMFAAPIHFPSESATIQIHKEHQDGDFDAAIIARSMRAKYRIK